MPPSPERPFLLAAKKSGSRYCCTCLYFCLLLLLSVFYCCLLSLLSFIIVVCIISRPGKLFRLSGHARPCRRSCPVEAFVRDQNIIVGRPMIKKNGSMTNRPTFPSDAVMFLRCRLHAGASSSNSLCPQQQLHFQDSSDYNSYFFDGSFSSLMP